MLKTLALCVMLLPGVVLAQSGDMTPGALIDILRTLDPEAEETPVGVALNIEDLPVLVVFDASANRMRAMVPIRAADAMSEAEVRRVLQANFDTALDARYAIARGQLWAVFIHPLAELQPRQLVSGLAQTVNIALTYGTLYSGGEAQFGGGDSGDLQRELIERLRNRGLDI